MKRIKSERKLCLLCMEEHIVDTIEVKDIETFKGEEVEFFATYEYCSATEDYLETEEMNKANNRAMKDIYRQNLNLLTSHEIIAIREKYKISQKDFSEVLDWGRATITRYENHQVQDRAHDDVLRKIGSDPKWFLEKLQRAREKGRINEKSFYKYQNAANQQYKKRGNQYLIDSIFASYAKYDDDIFNGFRELNLNKLVEMINYLAKNVKNLHKVKLMKMLWYSDILHFKRYEHSISGQIYCALPMGAVPEGHEKIVLLDGVKFDTVQYGETEAYKFKSVSDFAPRELTPSELKTLDDVISKLGDYSSDLIVEKMHEEDAYKCTKNNQPIPYSFAKALSID